MLISDWCWREVEDLLQTKSGMVPTNLSHFHL